MSRLWLLRLLRSLVHRLYLTSLMGERYKMVTKETKAVLSGEYGKTVKPFNKDVQKKCIGDKEADYLPSCRL